MRRPGGWPLTLFLTADGKPIYGGTYFPPDDREKDGATMPGLKTLIRAVTKFREEKPKELRQQADDVAERTTDLWPALARGAGLVRSGPRSCGRERWTP